jgi:hypothetical protein
VTVSGQRELYYTVNPKTEGTYSLHISVSGYGGSFDADVPLWIGRAQLQGADGGMSQAAPSTGGGGTTGMLVAADGSTLITAAVIIAIILTVLVGYFYLRRDE